MSEEQIVPVTDTQQDYQTPQTDQPAGNDPGKTEAEVAAEKEAPKETTRDVVAKAMEAAKAKAEAKEAEKAKAEKPVEKPAKEKPEAKAEDKTEAKPDADAKAEKQRAPDGKFAPKVAEEQPKEAVSDAPARFSEAAKKEWAAAPQSVRDEVTRAISENEAGIQKYRQQAERYESVKDFDDMARQSGTDLRTALTNYVGIEQKLRQDPIGGLEQVVNNLGLRDNQGNPITFRAIAAHVAGMTPDKVAAENDRTITELRQQVQNLTQQLGGVTKHFQEQQHAAKVASVQSEWDRFAAANPRATELEQTMAEVLRQYPAGDNISPSDRLRDAYAIAVARHPKTAQTGSGNPDAAQTGQGQRETAPRTPNPEGQKSVFGSPSSAAELPKAKDAKPLSSREAVEFAMRRATQL